LPANFADTFAPKILSPLSSPSDVLERRGAQLRVARLCWIERRPLRDADERRLFEIENAIADLYPRRPAPPAASWLRIPRRPKHRVTERVLESG
jgi:hypothetical protein